MRDLKKYKAPVADVTVFECADVITASQPKALDKTIGGEGKSYVSVGSKKWSDIYGGN